MPPLFYMANIAIGRIGAYTDKRAFGPRWLAMSCILWFGYACGAGWIVS